MKEFFKKRWNKLSSKHTNACLFWNGVIYIAFIATLCYSVEAAMCLSGIGSLFLLVIWIDDNEAVLDNSLWMFLTWLFWFGCLLALIVLAGVRGYEKTIGNFNDWLNSKRKED
jgi:hypothetical protein